MRNRGTVKTPVGLWSQLDERLGSRQLKAVSASAVRGTDGVIHVGLTNVDPNANATIIVKLEGISRKAVAGRLLTAGAMDAHNTFDRPDTVIPQPFSGARVTNGSLQVDLPPKSVVMLDLR